MVDAGNVMNEHLDKQLLDELKDMMEDEFSSLIDIYLRDSSARLQQITDAVNSADAHAVRESAHSLKGSSSNIGAVMLSALCQQMEEMGKQNQLANSQQLLSAISDELTIVQQALSALC